ncbi:MAG: protein kinase [Phycisphaerae bacterium]
MTDSDNNPTQPNAPRPTDSANPPAELKVLGDFEIYQVIGRGGMGTVYKARQRSLDRIVALKVLPNHVSNSPKAVQRFQREAQAAAKLHHTHIVPIFARGEVNGTYYYAMELVDGQGLNTIIAELRQARVCVEAAPDLAETVPLPRSSSFSDGRTGQESPAGQSTTSLHLGDSTADANKRFETIAAHIASVADALDYAHREGVIHRDVKPHNLMLGSDGRMRIADFGLARIAEMPGVTVTGEVVGSPLYMAPEALSGGQVNADHRADIYSLGATMYEWLTLSPPHPGDTRESVIGAILTSEPSPLRDHDPSIPLDLDTICRKAMSREPSRRYATAAELRDDLHRYLQDRAIKARRAGPVELSRQFVSRHQLATVTTVALVAVAALVWALLRTKAQIHAKDEAVASLRKDVEEIQQQAAAIKQGSLIDAMRLADPFSGAGVDVVSELLERSDLLAQSASHILEPDPINTAAVSTPFGIARRAAFDLYTHLVPPDYFEVGSTQLHRSKTAYELATAHDILVRTQLPSTALTMVEWYIERNGPDYDSMHLRTVLHSQLDDYEHMRSDAEMLVRLYPNNPVGYLWRGLANLLAKDIPQCLTNLERASGAEELSDWRQTFQGLAFVASGKAKDAATFLDSVLARSPTFVLALLARSSTAIAMGELSESIRFLSRVVEQEPTNANALVARGINQTALGHFEEAVADFQAATEQVGFSATILLQHKEASAGLRATGKTPKIKAPEAEQSSLVKPPVDTTGLKPDDDHTMHRIGVPRVPTHGRRRADLGYGEAFRRVFLALLR